MSDGFAPDGFQAGFVARHAAAAELLQQAFSPTPRAFSAVTLGMPVPKHFHPADHAANPTAGWNPLDANAPPSEYIDPVANKLAVGFAEGHAAGFAEGQAAALAGTAEREATDRALLSGLAAALATSGRIDRERVARHIRETVLLLVTKLVGEAGVAPDLLCRRVATATDLLADSAESALLRLHPEDVALVDGRLSATVFAIGDAAVARGSFVLESASTVVEDGPDLWLDQLAQAIDRVAVPATAQC